MQDFCFSGTYPSITYSASGTYTQLNAWRTFGVGDVYYIAGQSNAMVFFREGGDQSLVQYEATSDFPPESLNPPDNLINDTQT